MITFTSAPSHKTIKCIEENCEECEKKEREFTEISKDWPCTCGYAYHCSLPHCNNSVPWGSATCCDIRKHELQNDGYRYLRVTEDFYNRFLDVAYPNKGHDLTPKQDELVSEMISLLEEKYREYL